MAVQIRKSGDTTWTTATTAGIKYRAAGSNVWTQASSFKVQKNGVWVDSGYVAAPNAPTGLSATTLGNGDNKTMTFGWTAPSSGPAVSGYRFKIYSDSSPTTLTATLPSTTTVNTGTSVTVDFSKSPYSAVSGSKYQVEVVSVGSTGVESSPTARKRVTIGSPTTYGYTSSVAWVQAGLPGASTYWNSNERPASNMVDNNVYTIWSSNSRYNSSASNSYQGITVSSYGSGVGLDPYFNKPRKLVGIRLVTNHRGAIWAGYLVYGETGWQGLDSLSGVTGETAGYCNQAYIGHYDSAVVGLDGIVYVSYADLGFSPEDAIGAKIDIYKIVFGPALPYSSESAAYGPPYRVDVSSVDIGFRSYGITSNASANSLDAV